jgi:hypothetical protein
MLISEARNELLYTNAHMQNIGYRNIGWGDIGDPNEEENNEDPSLDGGLYLV